MSLLPGQVIDGKYRIVRLIGEGGMGSVHEGENVLISRRVAIKVLHAASAANAAVMKRFEREAQAAGRIGSDHILEVLDLGTLSDGDRYMVMEYLDGEELSARIERFGTMTAEQLAPLIRQTLVGLRAAHAAEIVHRDLKPDNIFILKEKAGQPDFVKLIDFGISKFNSLGGDLSMTTTGAVMGTPFYMSPEQAKGAAGVDGRTDLYAIGVIMYEALTGRVPFEGTSFNDLMFKIVLSEAEPLPGSIPADFRAIVTRAMAREPGDRFQTADELLREIEAWLASRGLLGRESSSSIHLQTMAASFALDSPQVGAQTTSKSSETQTNGNFAATNGGLEANSEGGAARGKATWVIGGGILLAAAGALLAWGLGTSRGEVVAEDLAATQSPSVARQPLDAGSERPSTSRSAPERAAASPGRSSTEGIQAHGTANAKAGPATPEVERAAASDQGATAEADSSQSSPSTSPTTASAPTKPTAKAPAVKTSSAKATTVKTAVSGTSAPKATTSRGTPKTTTKTPEKSGSRSTTSSASSGRDFGY